MYTTESLVWLYVEADGGESHISLPPTSPWVELVDGIVDLHRALAIAGFYLVLEA